MKLTKKERRKLTRKKRRRRKLTRKTLEVQGRRGGIDQDLQQTAMELRRRREVMTLW